MATKNITKHANIVPSDIDRAFIITFFSETWSRVLEELKKCILVCANCHGEIHTGLTDNNFVINLYKTKWDLIKTLHMGNVGFEPTILAL